MPADVVWAVPFQAWVQARLEAYGRDINSESQNKNGESPTIDRMANELSVSNKTVQKWARATRRNGMPLFTLDRNEVEDVLEHYDVPFWHIYPRHADLDDGEFTGYAWCEQCQSIEQTYNGRCAWHE